MSQMISLRYRAKLPLYSSVVYYESALRDVIDQLNAFSLFKYKSLLKELQTLARSIKQITPVDVAAGVSDLESETAKAREAAQFSTVTTELRQVSDDIISLDRFIRENFRLLTLEAMSADTRLGTSISQWVVASLTQAPFANVPIDDLLINLSACWGILRKQKETIKNDVVWRPPDSFVRNTTKYWVRPDRVSECKAAILEHMPFLIFGHSDEEIQKLVLGCPEEESRVDPNTSHSNPESTTSKQGQSSLSRISTSPTQNVPNAPKTDFLDLLMGPNTSPTPVVGHSEASKCPKMALGEPLTTPSDESRTSSIVAEQMVSSVYFDSIDGHSFDQRIRRMEGAELIRFRWYGDTYAASTPVFLERKTHHEGWSGLDSVKERFSLPQKRTVDFINGDWDLNRWVTHTVRSSGFTEAELVACVDVNDKIKSLEKSIAAAESGHVVDADIPLLQEQLQTEKSKFDSKRLSKAASLKKKVDNIVRLGSEINRSIQTHKLQPMVRTSYSRTAYQLASCNQVRFSLDTNLCMVNEFRSEHNEAVMRQEAIRRVVESGIVYADEESRDYAIEEEYQNILQLPADERPYPRIPSSSHWCRTSGEILSSDDVVRFPFAVLEVKLQTEQPEWVSSMLHRCGATMVYKFSKFQHGFAFLHNEKIGYDSPLPHWMEDFQNKGWATGYNVQLSYGGQSINPSLYNSLKCYTNVTNGGGRGRKGMYASNNGHPIALINTKKVDPKVVFAAERTFNHYLHKGIYAVTAGLLTLEFANRARVYHETETLVRRLSSELQREDLLEDISSLGLAPGNPENYGAYSHPEADIPATEAYAPYSGSHTLDKLLLSIFPLLSFIIIVGGLVTMIGSYSVYKMRIATIRGQLAKENRRYRLDNVFAPIVALGIIGVALVAQLSIAIYEAWDSTQFNFGGDRLF